MDYHEGYRAKSVGAYTESLHKFYHASGIENMLMKGDVRLLDICLGGGSNLSVTLDKVAGLDTPYKFHIVTVEKQSSLFNTIRNNRWLWPQRGYNILRKLIDDGQYGNIRLDIAIGDAASILERLPMTFDVVYFDPFGKRKIRRCGHWRFSARSTDCLKKAEESPPIHQEKSSGKTL